MIRTLDDVPEAVIVSLRFAQALWPHDPTTGSQATAIAWGGSLARYNVDDLCPVLESLALTHSQMPPLSTLLEELRLRHKPKPEPLLYPPAPPSTMPRSEFLRESRKRADAYREDLIAAKVRLLRGPVGMSIPVTPEELAAVRAWAYEVGPIEAKWLLDHGGVGEVTQPVRAGGNLDLKL